MSTLAEILLAEPQREALVADCVQLIETQVASRGTVRRLTLKAAMSALNTIRPNAVQRGIEKLLPDFATALEPLYQRFRQTGGRDFSRFLHDHPEETVQALIEVTDRRGREHGNAGVRSTYERMRSTAESEMRAALPGFSRVIGRRVA